MDGDGTLKLGSLYATRDAQRRHYDKGSSKTDTGLSRSLGQHVSVKNSTLVLTVKCENTGWSIVLASQKAHSLLESVVCSGPKQTLMNSSELQWQVSEMYEHSVIYGIFAFS